MKALLVYHDGSLGFHEVIDACRVLYKPMRMPLAQRVEDFDPTTSFPVIRFVSRGKAGPYLVMEEEGVK